MAKALLLIWVITSSVANGQTALQFDVATVKPSAPVRPGSWSTVGFGHTPTGVSYKNATLKKLIAAAFSVEEFQISGPEWIATERYEVVAKVSGKRTDGEIAEMLQALLADRFGLVARTEKKVLPVYLLMTAKNGAKLPEVEPGSSSGTSVLTGHLFLPRASISLLVAALSRQMQRPVLDRTELKGFYNVTLDWAPDTAAPIDDIAQPPIGAALQEQLGLRLEAAKLPVDVVTVERANKTPTAN